MFVFFQARLIYAPQPPAGDATAGSAILSVALRAPASLVEVLDEAAERVARDELLALERGARRGRGVVGREPLLDGAALVCMAVYLLRICDGEGR